MLLFTENIYFKKKKLSFSTNTIAEKIHLSLKVCGKCGLKLRKRAELTGFLLTRLIVQLL